MNPTIDIAIIGAGFAGLAAAIRLQQETDYRFMVFERANEVGGTWRDNVYPGCACDVPSHLYSFSFAPNPNWTRMFSTQPEILAYLKNCVTHYHLKDKIRYNTEITTLFFEAKEALWYLTDRQNNTYTAKVVIAATGPLNRPSIPPLKGIETFEGSAFHSSQWDTSVDLTHKKVAVIGTGASAIQIVPSIAPKVAQLTLFQRTAPWVTPRIDRAVTGFEKKLFHFFPIFQKAFRHTIYWTRELFGLAFLGNKTLAKLATWQAKQQLKSQVKDPILQQKLMPNYQIGCKRILVSNDYYPALNLPHVHVETTGIVEVKPQSIVCQDGSEHPAEVIIYGTGFEVADINWDLTVLGLNQRNLLAEWKQTGAEAYYGMSVSGFPNLLFLVGPNTGLGHNSIVHMIESQMNYVMDYLKILEKQGKNAYMDMKADIQQAFNEQLQHDLSHKTVWALGGCKSWYYSKKGKNTTLWSGLTVRYRRETKKASAEHYHVGARITQN